MSICYFISLFSNFYFPLTYIYSGYYKFWSHLTTLEISGDLTWYQSHLSVAMVFCSYGIFKSNLCLPRCFSSLRSSSLTSYYCRQNSPVQSSHCQKSHQHCKTIAFLKLPSQSQTSFKGSSQPYQISRFHQASILSLRGGVKDILAHQYRPKPNSTLCASQVSYLYQKSISLGFSLLYIHML